MADFIYSYGVESEEEPSPIAPAPGPAVLSPWGLPSEEVPGFTFMRSSWPFDYGVESEEVPGAINMVPTGQQPSNIPCCMPAVHPLPGRHLPRRLDYCYPYRRFRCLV